MEKSFEERIQIFKDFIREHNKIVFLGGAGVSTESGIPDFRSKDGLYNIKDVRFEKYQPEYLLSASCLEYEPIVFYEFYRQKLDNRKIKPNITHKYLSELEAQGKLTAVITQNIDGLHQAAGSKNVFEIHGTMQKNHCDKCHKEYPSDYIFDNKEPIPRCGCGGMIRPDVVLYGETLPAAPWNNAMKALKDADLLIIGGTSLTVHPANTLMQYYYGEDLVLINRDKTEYDGYANLVFRENLGDVFGRLSHAVRQ